MGVVNVESLLKPLSEAEPCGENLRWDRAYLELERLAEGKEETQYSAGEEPDWRQVRDVCVELLGRGRHLRIGLLLTVAATRMEGFPGLRDGLQVIAGWLTDSWDGIWPRLDAEDNNDPTERVNALAALATPIATYGDKTKFLDRVYEAPLCQSRQLGVFSLKDIAIAAGTLEQAAAQPGQEERPKPTLAVIDAAFAETDPEILNSIAEAAEAAMVHLDAIDAAFNSHCGEAVGPDTKLFRSLLKDAAGQIRRRQGVAVEGEEGGVTEDGSGDVGGGGGRSPISGEVNNSADVQLAFEKILRYYEGTERSSPVPLFVQCARRMVDQSFLDIVRVMTPDVVKMLDEIANPPQSS